MYHFWFVVVLLMAPVALADEPDFIDGYGRYFEVSADVAIPEGTHFKVAFDVAKTEVGEFSGAINSAARFYNMHLAHGVAEDEMTLAVVLHGAATHEIMNADAYRNRHDTENANIGLIEALISAGVRVIVCGQSAAYHEVKKDDMIDGVEVALSAMTAHALLVREGYTTNPF